MMDRLARSTRRARRADGRPGRRFRRPLLGLCTALAAVVGSAWVMVAEPDVSAAARTWYVSPDGSDGGTGYADDPLATIGRAVQRANSGDSVRIAAGTYHESVQVYGKAVFLKGAGIGRTVLDGARTVSGFRADGDGRWSAPWTTDFQRTVYDPYVPHVLPDRPQAGWPEQFFLDGRPLQEVTSRSAVVPGTFFHDRGGDRVVIADDPAGRVVEGSDLSWGLYLNRAHGSTVSGLSVNRYATEERHMAALRAYSNDLSLVDVEVRNNARMGLSIIGERVDVFRGQAIDNGYMGMHGHRSHDVSIRNSHLVGNNTEIFDAWHASAGMKITESSDIVFSGNTVSDNFGPGFWTDLDVTDAVVKNNYFRDNHRSGVEIELSERVIVTDNVATGNGEQGVWVLESSQVDVWHNYLAGNERAVQVMDGPRSDVNGVTIGNNVFATPASAGELVDVDDWTKQRHAGLMNVSLDGNRYWTNSSATDLLRWRWGTAASQFSEYGTLEYLRSAGHESNGQAVVGGSNPFTTARTGDATVPGRVEAVRSFSGAEGESSTSAESNGGALEGADDPAGDPAGGGSGGSGASGGGSDEGSAGGGAAGDGGDAGDGSAGWTRPGVVRGSARPVRLGAPSAAVEHRSAEVELGRSIVETSTIIDAAARPAEHGDAERVVAPGEVGWQSFADLLTEVLGDAA